MAKGTCEFLKRVFNKLLLNFTWWVNRKDRYGKNIFEGGFLGLDNIGVFDRSAPLPTGGYLEQADGTAWMALFCQNMAGNGRRTGRARPSLRGAWPTKFMEHFLWIAAAHEPVGGEGHVGRGGRVLLRRAAAAGWQRHTVESAFHGGTAAAVRDDGHRKIAAGAGAACVKRIRRAPSADAGTA